MRSFLIAAALAAPLFAQAAPNLVSNGSFESRLSGWTLSSSAGGYPVITVAYNFAAPAPGSSYGAPIASDDAAGNPSPDAAGNFAASFLSAYSAPQTLSQQLSLAAGSYDVGFDVYLSDSGLSNFSASLLGQTLMGDDVNHLAASQAQGWVHVSNTVAIASAGLYDLSFNFSSAFAAGQDVLLDRVYVISAVPEPGSYALMLAGLVGVGAIVRRRRNS